MGGMMSFFTSILVSVMVLFLASCNRSTLKDSDDLKTTETPNPFVVRLAVPAFELPAPAT